MSDEICSDYNGETISVDGASGVVVSVQTRGVDIPISQCAAFELGVELIERSGLMDGYKDRTPGKAWKIVEVDDE